MRAAAFAAVCVALTALGHTDAADHAVGPAALGSGFAVLFAVALMATARECSATAIGAATLGSQVVLHLLFTEVDPGPAAVSTMGAHAAAPCPDGWMPGLHLGLALLAAWWLRRGEVACFRLLRRVESGTAAALRSALAPLAGFTSALSAAEPDGAIPRLVRHEPGGCTTLLRSRCAPRRGPPRPSRPSTVGA